MPIPLQAKTQAGFFPPHCPAARTDGAMLQGTHGAAAAQEHPLKMYPHCVTFSVEELLQSQAGENLLGTEVDDVHFLVLTQNHSLPFLHTDISTLWRAL